MLFAHMQPILCVLHRLYCQRRHPQNRNGWCQFQLMLVFHPPQVLYHWFRHSVTSWNGFIVFSIIKSGCLRIVSFHYYAGQVGFHHEWRLFGNDDQFNRILDIQRQCLSCSMYEREIESTMSYIHWPSYAWRVKCLNVNSGMLLHPHNIAASISTRHYK